MHWFAKHGQPWSDAKAAGKATTLDSRLFTGRAERNGWDHSHLGSNTTPKVARVPDVAEINSGRPSKSDQAVVNHPATYPWQLAEWCGKLICPPGGTILDPFNGSASTGVAAIRNGWDYIGIDAVREYIDVSEQRLLHVTQQMEQDAS